MLLMSACSQFKTSPAWNPEASAPPSPESYWAPEQAPSDPYSLDDFFPEPSGSATPSPSQDASGPNPSPGILVELDEQVPLSDPDHPLELVDLIDIALRNNPSTRASWQNARMKAAELGEQMGTYYPTIVGDLSGGVLKDTLVFPDGTAIFEGAEVRPELRITYVLLDFGKRSASSEEARRRLAAANFSFNRELQRTLYQVQASFYEHDSARALKEAAEQNLELAVYVREDVTRRLELGLATRPDFLLAKQVEAQAVYDLEVSKVGVFNTRSRLALNMGLPANAELSTSSLFEQPLPPELDAEVDLLINLALRQRPDLQAQVARLRASEASVAKAKADFLPTLGLDGTFGGLWGSYTLSGKGVGNPSIDTDTRRHGFSSVYDAQVILSWPLFEGFSRKNRVRKAVADRERERERLRAIEIEATNEVWSIYNDYQASYRKYDYGLALLEASEEAYQATLESYDAGLRTIDDLLRSERDLAQARYTLIGARSSLLSTAARLGFALGAVPENPRTRNTPSDLESPPL